MVSEIKFKVEENFDFVQAFAEQFHTTVTNNEVTLPDYLGEGFIKEIQLNNGIRLCLHRYHLKQAFTLRRLESDNADWLTIKFTRNGFFSNEEDNSSSGDYKFLHAVEVATNNLLTEAMLPAEAAIFFLVINISRKVLVNLLRLDSHSALRNTLCNEPSFVFYESLSVEMERTMVQMQDIKQNAPFHSLLYEGKVYELLYQLFNKLLGRNTTELIAVNKVDAEKIYMLKDTIIADLSIAPKLPQLARSIGMSETKMKTLFQQIFGQSIYNHFQSARMNEATHLLSRSSVSETAYRLGFTNRSHFTRLFEKHHHIKPKKYKDSLPLIRNIGSQLEMADRTNL